MNTMKLSEFVENKLNHISPVASYDPPSTRRWTIGYGNYYYDPAMVYFHMECYWEDLLVNARQHGVLCGPESTTVENYVCIGNFIIRA